jgi:4-amino-4-deoxy-L-arabinose transferase-like glycosyltransferase
MFPQNRSWFLRPLVLVLLVAVVLRIIAAYLLGDRVTVLPAIHDQVSYDALAQSLLEGKGYRFSQNWYPFTPANTPTAHWSFLYPLFLALVYAVMDYHPLAARLIQGIAGGLLTSLLVYRIGARTAGERAGLIGAALAAIYLYFIYYNVALMTETFFILSVLWIIDLNLELKTSPSLKGWFLIGLAFGIAALLRQTILLIMPAFLLWLLIEHKGRLPIWHYAVPLGVAAMLIVPWTVRNQLVYGTFLPLNSNVGYAFYAANHPHLEMDWQNDLVVVPIPTAYAGQNEAELNKLLMRDSLRFIMEDPVRYIRLSLDKTLEMFKFWPSSESGMVSNVARVLSFGISLPFMLLGLVLSLSRWRHFIPLYLFALLHTGIHLLSWPAPRYRLPVDAVFMVFVGLAIHQLGRWLLNLRQTKFAKHNYHPEAG